MASSPSRLKRTKSEKTMSPSAGREWKTTADFFAAEQKRGDEKAFTEIKEKHEAAEQRIRVLEDSLASLREENAQLKGLNEHDINASLSEITVLRMGQGETKSDVKVVKRGLEDMIARTDEIRERAVLERKATNLAGIDPNIAPPTENVSLVVIDVPGSRDLWRELPQEMVAAVMLFTRLCREEIDNWGGYESIASGDLYVAAFKRATDAVQFACNVQSRLLQTPWPRKILAHPLASPELHKGQYLYRGLRVRIGIHIEEKPDFIVDDLTDRVKYGTVLDVTRIVCSAGSPGQTLATDGAWRAIKKEGEDGGRLLASVEVTNLGVYDINPTIDSVLDGKKQQLRLRQIMPENLKSRSFSAVGFSRGLGAVVGAVEADVSELEEDIASMTRDVASLETEIKFKSSEAARIEIALRQLDIASDEQPLTDMANIAADLGEVRRDASRLGTKVEELQSTVQSSSKRIDELRGVDDENAKLIIALANSQASNKSLRELTTRALEELTRARDIVHENREEYDSIAEELRALHGSMI